MPENYHLFRVIVGCIFLGDLLLLTPSFRRYFGRAYFPSSCIATPGQTLAVWLIWCAATISLIVGFHPLGGSLVLAILFRYFHIDARYVSLSRGAGAVGLMPYHTALFLSLFEFSLLADSAGLQRAVFLVYRIDLCMIMLDAGLAKLLTGYAQGEGVEYALANPFWGRWFHSVRRSAPGASLYRIQNLCGAGIELLIAPLVLFPGTEMIGGLLLMLTFLWVGTALRLLLLPPLMISIGILFLPDAGFALTVQTLPEWNVPPFITRAAIVSLFAYAAIEMAIKVVQYLNYFAGVVLPGRLQRVMDAVAVRIPVFIWRVFTADVINFFVRIRETGDSESRTILDESTLCLTGPATLSQKLRFLNAAESVVLSALFGRVKYEDSQRTEMHARMLRYADSLQHLRTDPCSILQFEYVAIRKGPHSFQYVPLFQWDVCTETRHVRERPLTDQIDKDALAPGSVVRPTQSTGSYAPASLPRTM